MKNYIINYSFTGNQGLTISGQIEVMAGDNQQARNEVVNQLRNKYAANVTTKNVWWNKPVKQS